MGFIWIKDRREGIQRYVNTDYIVSVREHGTGCVVAIDYGMPKVIESDVSLPNMANQIAMARVSDVRVIDTVRVEGPER